MLKEKVYEIAEFYHKHIYTRFAENVSNITNSSEQCYTDILLHLYAHSKHIGMAMLFSLLGVSSLAMYSLSQASYEIRGQVVSYETVLAICAIAVLCGISAPTVFMMSIYGMNFFRKPLSEKLNLEEKIFNPVDDFQFLVKKINTYFSGDEMREEFFPDMISRSATTYFQGIDGYPIHNAPKGKKTKLRDVLTKNIGAWGHFNMLFQEVVLPEERLYFELAHETSHAKGITREADAQLAAVLLCITSDEPQVQYLGYLYWLYLLLPTLYKTWGAEDGQEIDFPFVKLHLLAEGLCERAIQDLEEREALEKQLEPEASKKKAMTTNYNRILKILGQPEVKQSYLVKPLKLLHSYREKYLDQ